MQDVKFTRSTAKLVGGHSRPLVMLSRLLLVVAATLPSSAAQQNADATAWLQFIGMELRQLRIELLEQRVAEEGDRLLQIERDLASIRLEQSKYRSEEQSQKQQLAELDRHANESEADPQARANIQTIKSELASTAELTRVAFGSLTAREAELNERLRTARTRLQSITGRLKQLSAPER